MHRLTSLAAASLRAAGYEVVNDSWFDTITVATPGSAEELMTSALKRGINLGRVDEDHVRIAFDETTTEQIVERLLDGFRRSVWPASSRCVDSGRPGQAVGVHDPPGVQPAPVGALDAPLPAAPRRSRPRPRPNHDPARVLHHEAQRNDRDDPDHLARVLQDPSLCAARTRWRDIWS